VRPSHTAFIVRNGREGSNEKPRWIEVGAVWPHRSGAGFDLVLVDQISVSGRLVCTVRKDRESGDPDHGHE
jgi:hypothetical protein